MSKKEVVKKLKEVLADSYVLYLKTQNFHWNVTGPNFKSLHELFGAQYEELAEAIDTLAERIRALGEHAPGSFKEFLELTSLHEAKEEVLPAPELLKQLVHDHKAVLKTIGNALDVAQEDHDEATADMLITRLEEHDKHKWMLSSSL